MTRYEEFPFPGLPSIHELTDASNECRHGRLPFDKGPRCSCWHISWSPVKTDPPRVRRWCYPEHVRNRAVSLYANGMSFRQVAMRVGVAKGTVAEWVRAAGVEVRDGREAA